MNIVNYLHVYYNESEYWDPKVIVIAVILLTLLHSERPKSYTILAFLSVVGLNLDPS